MKKDLHCKYSILDKDVCSEHKVGRINICSSVVLHNHDGYEIILFLGGKDVSYFVESDGKVLERGDLIFISPFAFHGLKLIDVSSYERAVIHIRPPYLQSLSDKNIDLSLCFHKMPAKRLNVIHLSEPEIQRFVSIADALEKTISTRSYGHTILEKAYLSELMVMANQCAETFHTQLYSNIMPSVVKKTFEFVDENITSDITVESLAVHFHHNSDYLSRAFKATTGLSLKHYITAKKIALAQQYLCQGTPPSDVCFMIGYNNYSSFSRRFSAQVGLSPKQYQQNSQLSSL